MSELTDKVMRKIAAMEADGWDMADFRAALAERDKRIEELTAEVASLTANYPKSAIDLERENEKLTVEVGRMRGALEKIVEISGHYSASDLHTGGDINAIARTALEGNHAD